MLAWQKMLKMFNLNQSTLLKEPRFLGEEAFQIGIKLNPSKWTGKWSTFLYLNCCLLKVSVSEE